MMFDEGWMVSRRCGWDGRQLVAPGVGAASVPPLLRNSGFGRPLFLHPTPLCREKTFYCMQYRYTNDATRNQNLWTPPDDPNR